MNAKIIITGFALGALCLSPLHAGARKPAPAKPQPAEAKAVYQGVSHPVRADISPPLRDITPKTSLFPSKAENDEEEFPWAGKHGPLDMVDPAAQTWLRPGDAPSAMPAPNVSFDGFANLCGGCAPPDPVGEVGPNHYVAMANSTIAVYSKTGTVLLTPRNINTIWTGFGGNCETENAGDPVVLYDQFADRWLISQFTAAGPTYYNCVALSTSGDPLGTWQRYAFSNGTSFPDYPKYGIWRDAYYFNTRNTSGSTGMGAYALNRAQMLAGSLTPQVVQFLLPPGTTPYYGGDGLLPADIDGTTLPPVGAPEIFIGSMDNGGPYTAPSDGLNIFQFHVDWVTPASSTFTRLATVPVDPFDSTFTPCGGARTCIPQPGTANKIDILSYRQRVTYRAAYRNFGDHEAIVTNQSVSGFNTGTANAIAGVRWYELRDPNGTPTLFQQGTYVPGATDGIHRWMGSAAMDRVGNLAIGYSASSGTVAPGLRYTGRLVGDPAGTLPQGEGILVNGVGSQTGGGNRWGDYSALTVDPVDDCTFWYINEYYTVSSAATWNLRIGSFTFPSCLCAATPAAPVATGATASAANQITVNWNDAAGASITRYFVSRATAPGGPYTRIATLPDSSPGTGGGAPYGYNDTTVSGGTTYYYQIAADDGVSCTSAASNTVSATATGTCTLSPTFAGATGAVNNGTASCGVTVNWAAGASNCGGGVTYSVYRSTTSGFTPSPANRIALGASGTSYLDLAGLASGTTYYYIVRASDGSGNSESNTAERSATPTGPGGGTVVYTSTDVPKAIPDNLPAGVNSTLTVAGNANIVTDVNVTLNATHTWDGDLSFTLTSPAAATVALITRRGGSGDNFTNTVLDDSAAAAIGTGTAPFTGSFKPEALLAGVNNIPANGTWTLFANDSAAADTGSITGWSLAITTASSCTTCSGTPLAMSTLAQTKSGLDLTQNWPAVAGAVTYNVYRDITANVPTWSAPAIASGLAVLTYTDTNQLGNATTQFYSVTDVNGCGVESPK